MIFQKIELRPDQHYAIGFGDGLAGRPRDKRFSEHMDYVLGHCQGRRDNPNSLENLPAVKESYNEIGWGDERLNPFPG
jgi:hypothetical protein